MSIFFHIPREMTPRYFSFAFFKITLEEERTFVNDLPIVFVRKLLCELKNFLV